ncbi:MAG: molybdopterin converting factor subunit 1 [Oceanospirillaceae bacterium]|nr:molybdopterin converting factor subunit 1 [Oceanospirillaceae bacterium]MBT4442374.1 molybdopterin converting factor subunit 1 [Oceanospirillaceae bacterium]MBT6078261.1 molybdopterin converting factor subunit 1 [Oceanospirillaceae bacterium]
MIKVLFFGQLKDQLQADVVEVQSDAPQTVSELLVNIIEERPDWAHDLSNEQLLVAVDQVMAKSDTLVPVAAEVAFFPPVTGG